MSVGVFPLLLQLGSECVATAVQDSVVTLQMPVISLLVTVLETISFFFTFLSIFMPVFTEDYVRNFVRSDKNVICRNCLCTVLRGLYV